MFMNSTKLLFNMTMIVGVMVCLCSNNWFMMWSGLEISMISFLPLMEGKLLLKSESMMKYFIVQGTSSSLLIMGMILMLSKLNLGEIFIYISICIKIGLAPFHNWVLTVIEGLSYYSLYIILVIMKIGPLVLISYLNLSIILISMITLLVGSIFGLNQSSLRKIFGYSSVFNLGFISSCMMNSYVWLSYYLIYSFILLSTILFINKINFNYMNQTVMMEYMISIKIGFWIMLLSLSGIPPMLGFLSKLMVIELMLIEGKIVLVILMIMLSLMVTFYYMRMMYFSLMFSSVTSKWMLIKITNMNFLMVTINLLSIMLFISLKSLS